MRRASVATCGHDVCVRFARLWALPRAEGSFCFGARLANPCSLRYGSHRSDALHDGRSTGGPAVRDARRRSWEARPTPPRIGSGTARLPFDTCGERAGGASTARTYTADAGPSRVSCRFCVRCVAPRRRGKPASSLRSGRCGQCAGLRERLHREAPCPDARGGWNAYQPRAGALATRSLNVRYSIPQRCA